MARRDRPRLRRALTWAAGAVTLIASATLLQRFVPAVRRPPDATGRGRPSTPPSSRALAFGFEPLDLGGRNLALYIVGLGIVVTAVIGVMFLMLGLFHAENRASAPPLTPQQTAKVVPPEPRLQANPVADIGRQIAHEEQLIHAYGWANTAHTRARIPIGRAMTLIVGHKLDAPP